MVLWHWCCSNFFPSPHSPAFLTLSCPKKWGCCFDASFPWTQAPLNQDFSEMRVNSGLTKIKQTGHIRKEPEAEAEITKTSPKQMVVTKPEWLIHWLRQPKTSPTNYQPRAEKMTSWWFQSIWKKTLVWIISPEIWDEHQKKLLNHHLDDVWATKKKPLTPYLSQIKSHMQGGPRTDPYTWSSLWGPKKMAENN